MAAIVTWLESNASVGEDAVITNSNWGSTAAANLDPTAYPITAGDSSFEKWHRLLVSLNGSAISVSNVRFYAQTMVPALNTTLRTSASTVAAPVTTWESPAETTDKYNANVTTTDPAAPNVGISGALAGSVYHTTGGTTLYTDWFVHGIVTTASATAGPASDYTLAVRWDEVQ